MKVLNIEFNVKPDNRRELLQTIKSLFDKGKCEKGRISSHLYRDVYEETHFNIKEEWRREEDLRRYLSSDLFGILLGALNLLGESRNVKIESLTEFLDESELMELRDKSNGSLKSP